MPSTERARGRNRERSLGGGGRGQRQRGGEFLGFGGAVAEEDLGWDLPVRGGEQRSREERDKVGDEFLEEEKRKRESQTDGLLGLLSGGRRDGYLYGPYCPPLRDSFGHRQFGMVSLICICSGAGAGCIPSEVDGGAGGRDRRWPAVGRSTGATAEEQGGDGGGPGWSVE